MTLKLLTLETEPSPAVLNLLDQNVIGTPGESLVYQQLDMRHKIDKIKKPHFLNLNRRGLTIATCCFCERETEIETLSVSAFYVRYFTFLKSFRPQTKRRLDQKESKKNQIRDEVKYILAGNELINGKQPAYFYAYVDPNNVRSSILCEELGFENLGNFKSYIVGRLFPKKRIHFSRVTTSNRSVISDILSKQYQDYNAYTTEGLFDHDHYYYVKNDDGQIVVGLQAYKTNWSVQELGGRFGKLLLNILNYTPILNRLIQKQYQFVAIDHIILKSGNEEKLEELIESILNEFKLYTALILIDIKSILYTSIEKIDTGLIGRLKASNSIHIIFKPLNIKDAGLKMIKKRPTFISSFDTT